MHRFGCCFDLSFFEGNIEMNARLVMLLRDLERDFRVVCRGSWRVLLSVGMQSRTTRPRSWTAFWRSSSSDETFRCFMWSSSESEDCDDQPWLLLAGAWNMFFLPFMLSYSLCSLLFLLSSSGWPGRSLTMCLDLCVLFPSNRYFSRNSRIRLVFRVAWKATNATCVV